MRWRQSKQTQYTADAVLDGGNVPIFPTSHHFPHFVERTRFRRKVAGFSGTGQESGTNHPQGELLCSKKTHSDKEEQSSRRVLARANDEKDRLQKLRELTMPEGTSP